MKINEEETAIPEKKNSSKKRYQSKTKMDIDKSIQDDWDIMVAELESDS